ncbi:MAG TPA: aminotransferase class I/II-fold pyridoxal phosphate-dependent enzyme, partial [Marmoricola sp.]|nr:aminotransferase class I/II-fold pyridoxal phosphate-dependent enzyme [Marmoricola sp.]
MSDTWPPLRGELHGVAPYGAPQLDVPVALNVNENPYGPSEVVVADIAAAVTEVAGSLNRYPDREFTELRKALADYLGRESGVALAPEQLWAANGSNEVMLQLLQAFGGPGHTAVSFAPTYSMYPEYARDSMTRWVAGRRRDDFGFDLDHARALVEEER